MHIAGERRGGYLRCEMEQNHTIGYDHLFNGLRGTVHHKPYKGPTVPQTTAINSAQIRLNESAENKILLN